MANKKVRFINTLALCGFMGSAAIGCGGSSNAPPSGAAGSGGSTTEDLELLSWWVAPGEAQALQALKDTYTTDYKGATVNQFTDVNSGNWNMVLSMYIDTPKFDVTQMSAADFGSWMQAHTNSLLPLDDYYADPALAAAIIPDILAATKVNGHPMGMATGVARNFSFLYNMQLLKASNITPPASPTEFLAACATLKAAGVNYPVATSLDSWVLRFMYWEILAGEVGAQKFGDYVLHNTPVTDQTIQDGIKNAVDVFDTVMTQYVDVTSAKATGYDWSHAASALKAGTSAMMLHGDWAKGYLVALGWTPGVDFGVSGPPGASDLFVYGVDTFALPETAPHPDAAKHFLTVVGSKEGQVAFNKQKGSTPMRSDVRDMLDPAGQAALDDLVNAKVRIPGFDTSAVDDAMTKYVMDGDKAELLTALQAVTP
jgi:glucose/mannose transport system substrate-binding protein